MRFKQAGVVRFFERAFETAVQPWREQPQDSRTRHPLRRWFPDVVVWDSTMMQVADSLRRTFRGTRGPKASLKASLAISIFGHLPLFARVGRGNQHDMLIFPPFELFQRGTLLLFDKGFACYDRLRSICLAGHNFVCPMRLNGNAHVVAVHDAPAWVRRALKEDPGITLRELLPADKRLGRTWDLDVLLRPQANAADKTWIVMRLVIIPGPRGRQHPYLTSLSRALWRPAAVRELYRLRWQIELVFKELKQHLNLTALPSKDQHAVQVFAWASLIALAVSRTVSHWVQPLRPLAGLINALRPMLISRALRATVRLLGRIVVAPVIEAVLYLRLFFGELRREARSPETSREDSFKRLRALLPSTA
jgi:hypothetical protein